MCVCVSLSLSLSQVLLTLARLLSEEQKSMENLLGKMAATILPFARAQYCTIFIARDRPKVTTTMMSYPVLYDRQSPYYSTVSILRELCRPLSPSS